MRHVIASHRERNSYFMLSYPPLDVKNVKSGYVYEPAGNEQTLVRAHSCLEWVQNATFASYVQRLRRI